MCRNAVREELSLRTTSGSTLDACSRSWRSWQCSSTSSGSWTSMSLSEMEKGRPSGMDTCWVLKGS
jgi:hypothetical protein